MNMSVDQTGSGIGAAGIDLFLSGLVIPKADDPSVFHGDAVLPDSAGIYVNHVAVTDHQVSGDPVHRRIDNAAQYPLVHVFHTEASFRDEGIKQ